jgi:hypothetical protein
MKLNYHKNLENHLLKNGFKIKSKIEGDISPRTIMFLRNFEIYIYPSTTRIYVWFKRNHFDLLVQGCKTLNDLYRLEKLIEGTNKTETNETI